MPCRPDLDRRGEHLRAVAIAAPADQRLDVDRAVPGPPAELPSRALRTRAQLRDLLGHALERHPQQLAGVARARSWRRMSSTASGPVTASIRRTFAALEVSLSTLNTPISEVQRTCVPPHSSREKEPSPTSTIRTTSPYFSPNSAIAPSRLASSSVVVSARTGGPRGSSG